MDCGRAEGRSPSANADCQSDRASQRTDDWRAYDTTNRYRDCRGGFITSSLANEFAIIQLGGGKVYNLKGVRLATWFDAGFGNAKPTAVKDFEVWVSATTPDPASFTRVLVGVRGFCWQCSDLHLSRWPGAGALCEICAPLIIREPEQLSTPRLST